MIIPFYWSGNNKVGNLNVLYNLKFRYIFINYLREGGVEGGGVPCTIVCASAMEAITQCKNH